MSRSRQLIPVTLHRKQDLLLVLQGLDASLGSLLMHHMEALTSSESQVQALGYSNKEGTCKCGGMKMHPWMSPVNILAEEPAL